MNEGERMLWDSILKMVIGWAFSDPDGDGRNVLQELIELIFNHRMHPEDK